MGNYVCLVKPGRLHNSRCACQIPGSLHNRSWQIERRDARRKLIGFTGTRSGLTEAQRDSLRAVLEPLQQGLELHHGDCVGADAEVHAIALAQDGLVVKHPASNVGESRAYCVGGLELPAQPPLERNHTIVNCTDALIACPRGQTEELRSGTWATVRYARKLGRPVVIIYPDGTIENERL